ncbi:hypothetical protein MKK69_01640 [Methylobacterium sp. J-026]|uniref:hypothetical protein n=1 Tax=Methylobacterium sp. J-026 TaxID=2836624 RepID=UPI001FB8D415|nr:hypothetical protein [Methylobacterium sp. J-026]MCJ2132778.1 hypothetical protein [Methylobacterium sp. J-026]
MAVDPKRFKAPLAIVFLCSVLAACQGPDASTYTLYRNSVINDGARIHVASFDAADGEAYNRENCAAATDLFGGQPGTRTRFWCEKGRFRS